MINCLLSSNLKINNVQIDTHTKIPLVREQMKEEFGFSKRCKCLLKRTREF